MHGLLPLARFYPDDVRHNRRRCKRCMAERVAVRRQTHPLQTLWRRLVQRARARFSTMSAVSQWTWQEHGRRALLRLLSAMPASTDADLGPALIQSYVLTWPEGTQELTNVEQLVLRRRRQHKGRQQQQQAISFTGDEKMHEEAAPNSSSAGDSDSSR